MTLNLIADCFSGNDWKSEEVDLQGVVMFRYKTTALRIAAVLASVPDVAETLVIGVVLLFRSADDSMNMEVTVPLDRKELVVMKEVAVSMCADKPLSHDKFLANLRQWYSSKNRRVIGREEPTDSNAPPAQTSAVQPPEQKSAVSASTTAEATASTTKRPRAETGSSAEDQVRAEVADESVCCVVCQTADADTLALPCMHRVVCYGCSLTLNKQAHQATKCVICRQPIDSVCYPDNSVRSTRTKHEN